MQSFFEGVSARQRGRMLTVVKPVIKSVISDVERAERIASVEYGRASVRLEGYVIGPEHEALAQRYIDGELTSAEYTAEGLALADSQFKQASQINRLG
jgi:Antitoxin VbhA